MKTSDINQINEPVHAWEIQTSSMLLRDWFAGQALPGILACPESYGSISETAKAAYAYADAMLEGHSVADKIISAQFQTRVDAAITQWIAGHEPEVKEAVDRAMSRGIGACLMTALDQRFQGLFASGLEQMYQQGILKRPGTL